MGTWSSVTYRALVANAVITKQSCSRIKKKKIYKDKRGDEKWSQGLWLFFRHITWKAWQKKLIAYLCSKAIYFPGTALFDAMAVLAMLKLPNCRNSLHLHAPAQPIMPPEQHMYHIILYRQQLKKANRYLNREEKREMLTERLKQQQQQQEWKQRNPQNLRETKVWFVRAGKTDTCVSEAKEK